MRFLAFVVVGAMLSFAVSAAECLPLAVWEWNGSWEPQGDAQGTFVFGDRDVPLLAPVTEIMREGNTITFCAGELPPSLHPECTLHNTTARWILGNPNDEHFNLSWSGGETSGSLLLSPYNATVLETAAVPIMFSWLSNGSHAALFSPSPARCPVCGDGNVNQENEQCEPAGTATCDSQCQMVTEALTCQEAIRQGLLRGSIENGTAIVTNDADIPYTVSLASYEMYAALIEDQTLFDSNTGSVAANASRSFEVALPDCAYQIDLVCGSPLPFNPLYDDLVVRSEFGNQNEFCTPGPRPGETSVTVTIADGYPQQRDYVFLCAAEGFSPTRYYWYFGDGELLPDSFRSDVFHRYVNPGSYIVACTATDGEIWQTGTLEVEVDGAPELDLTLLPGYPQGLTVGLKCEPSGFDPPLLDWDLGDGTAFIATPARELVHHYASSGEYTASCAADFQGERIEDSVTFAVADCPDFSVTIDHFSPEKGVEVLVQGSLSSSQGGDLSGEALEVNGKPVGILLNRWALSMAFLQDALIVATYTDACGRDHVASRQVAFEEKNGTNTTQPDNQTNSTTPTPGANETNTTVPSPPNSNETLNTMPPVVDTTQSSAVLSSLLASGKSCWPGFHWNRAGHCIRDEVFVPTVNEEPEIVEEEPSAGGNSTLPEENAMSPAAPIESAAITGAVTGVLAQASILFLAALLGLILILYGLAGVQRNEKEP